MAITTWNLGETAVISMAKMTYEISIYLNSSCELLGGLGRPNGKGLPANAKSPQEGDR